MSRPGERVTWSSCTPSMLLATRRSRTRRREWCRHPIDQSEGSYYNQRNAASWIIMGALEFVASRRSLVAYHVIGAGIWHLRGSKHSCVYGTWFWHALLRLERGARPEKVPRASCPGPDASGSVNTTLLSGRTGHRFMWITWMFRIMHHHYRERSRGNIIRNTFVSSVDYFHLSFS